MEKLQKALGPSFYTEPALSLCKGSTIEQTSLAGNAAGFKRTLRVEGLLMSVLRPNAAGIVWG